MDVFLIAVVIFLYSFQTLFCKLFTDKYPDRSELSSPVFCVLEGAFIFVFSFIWGGCKFAPSVFTVVMGLLNAGALFGYNTTLIAAGKKGSYAFMNVLMLFGGIIVPTIYGAVFLGEGFTLVKFIGISIMLVACVLMNLEEMKMKNTPLVYYILCIMLFIFNGLYGTFVKIQTVYRENEKQEMVMLTFGLMGLVALIQLMAKEKKDTFKAFKLNKKCGLPLVICLFSAAAAVNLLVLILPLVDTAVFYTVENGGVLLLAAVYSVLFFKEKLSTPKAIGVLLGIASITILSV